MADLAQVIGTGIIRITVQAEEMKAAFAAIRSHLSKFVTAHKAEMASLAGGFALGAGAAAGFFTSILAAAGAADPVRWEQLGVQLKILALTLGKFFIPLLEGTITVLRNIIKWLETWTDSIAAFFDKVYQGIKSVIKETIIAAQILGSHKKDFLLDPKGTQRVLSMEYDLKHPHAKPDLIKHDYAPLLPQVPPRLLSIGDAFKKNLEGAHNDPQLEYTRKLYEAANRTNDKLDRIADNQDKKDGGGLI